MFSLRKRAKAAVSPAPTGIRDTVAGISGQIDHLVAISRDNAATTSDRITACEIVRSFVEFQSLSSITEIWYAMRDVTSLENTADLRRAGWRLALSCINHDEINNSAFTAYYSSIIRNSNVEDLDLVLTCLEHLTNSGRRIVGSQAPRHLPRVLLEWIQMLAIRAQELRGNASAQDIATQWGFSTEDAFFRCLNYTANLLKFNMAAWDPIEIEKLLLIVVQIIRTTSQVEDCEICCTLVESVIAYGLMPAPVLQPILEVLCGMSSMIDGLKPKCVSIIRKLCRSHLQNSTIVRLCRILDSPTSEITQSMRIAAAQQLSDLVMMDGGSERGDASPRLAPSLGAVPTPSSSAASVTVGSALSSSSANAAPKVMEDFNSSQDESSLDVSLPILDVLESYYKTLQSEATPLRLSLSILRCFCDLISGFDLLKRMHTSSWLWPDTEGEVEGSQVSPTSIVSELSQIYVTYESKLAADDEVLTDYRDSMRQLGTLLTVRLSDKLLSTSLSSQILICVHLSRFLDTDTCEKLLEAIETLQFCTPGVTSWFDHLSEVMRHIYLKRTDRCRARVLSTVSDVYTLDADKEGWINTEDLQWITKVAFSVCSVADTNTLDVLMSIYDNHVFLSSPEVFETATRELILTACSQSLEPKSNQQDERAERTGLVVAEQTGLRSPSFARDPTLPEYENPKGNLSNRLRSVEAITVAFAHSYRLYARQALLLLEGLGEICHKTLDDPDVFVKAWAVLCRLRCDRWDRLLIVNQRLEESYNEELRGMQEPIPSQLQEIHAIPSLVLKLKTKHGGGLQVAEGATFDTLPILDIIIKVLKSPSTKERPLVVVMLNAASQLAHYRLLCQADQDRKLPKLEELRDELESLIASGGSKIPQSTISSSVRRTAVLNITLHILSVLVPFKPLFPKSEHDRLVNTLVTALGRWNLTTGWVVHCFTLACYEAPSSLQRYLPQILSRLQLKITGRDSSMYILDFLLSLSLEGSLTKNFTQQDYKRVFGMCFSFIQNANDLLALRYQSDITAQWLLRLAYGAISNLFLSMQLETRRSLVPYLVRSLVLATRDPTWVDPMSLVVYDMINRFSYSDVPLRAHMDTVPRRDPSWETRRWLRGVAICEISCNRRTGEAVRVIRRPAGIFTTHMTPAVVSEFGSGFDPLDLEGDESGGNYTANFYLLCGQLGLGTFLYGAGMESSDRIAAGLKRPAALGLNNTAPAGAGSAASSANGGGLTAAGITSPDRHMQGSSRSMETLNSQAKPDVDPSASGIKGDNAPSEQSEAREDVTEWPAGSATPLALPDDAATNRAINALDRVPIVDLLKVGIIYCAPGQNKEAEILANSSGSTAYRKFLEGIGVLIRLKHNRMYYVGGLDTESDLDGQYALAWSSKISQIIFHTITMMPNYEGDTQFASKKRHIGNNFVNIYFDESGEDFEFELVKSQFNFINVVITPTYTRADENHQQYWKVRAYRKSGMRNTSAAYDVKVVNEDNLALFVRNLALKASQYAAIHNLGSEFQDNWVYRLQLIKTLRERVETAQNAAAQAKRDDEHEAQKADDENYLIEEVPEQPDLGDEIRQLSWMDFTKFTI